MSDKIYCGSGKEFGRYNTINVSICLSDLPKEYINEFNGKKYIKLNINKKREVDRFGKTHSVEVDTWRPDSKPESNPFEAEEPLPF